MQIRTQRVPFDGSAISVVLLSYSDDACAAKQQQNTVPVL